MIICLIPAVIAVLFRGRKRACYLVLLRLYGRSSSGLVFLVFWGLGIKDMHRPGKRHGLRRAEEGKPFSLFKIE